MADQDCIEWRPVVGWDRYSVSNTGLVVRVAGHFTSKRLGVPLKQHVDSAGLGYQLVRLCKDSKPQSRSVHVLVCEAFHGPRPPGMQVDHIDGNPSNNHASNLRWVTPLVNTRCAIERNAGCPGNRGESQHSARLTGFQVRIMRWIRDFGAERGWQRMLSEIWDIEFNTINSAVHGRSWNKGT